MAYKALYRTYRPQFFREVVGQEAIVKTLQNTIANNKISHAYLFSGPRGTGKTSIARIFAKVLNCGNVTMLEPCNKCKSCYEISDGISPDVIEIDAASNNGVDEIRDIREKIKFLPSGTKYKIYIIDEVHMLSTGAFNALLKTLEEPPQHVIFILATTEPQKLPSTIVSRCQRFDFKALTINEISKKIRIICAEEEVEISEEAVNAISKAAEGALRDALSILDQAITYSDDVINIEDVNAVTGNISYDKLIELATHFLNGNANSALETINDLIDLGKEVNKIVTGLLQFYRDMLLYQNIDANSIMYYKYVFGKENFIELAKITQPEKIFHYIDILSDVQMKIKYASTPRIYLEIAAIKMANTNYSQTNINERIDALENKVNNLSEMNENLDNEKVNLLEIKINKIVDEFYKLELHKIAEKISHLQLKDFDNAKVSIDNINKEIKLIKEKLNNKILDTNNKESEQKLINLQEDVNKIKLAITEIKNNNYDIKNEQSDYREIKLKIKSLESKIYQITSEKMSSKEKNNPKKQKIPPQQIALFENDLTPIEEIKTEEVNVSFEDVKKGQNKTKDDNDGNKEVEQGVEETKPQKLKKEENNTKDEDENIFKQEKEILTEEITKTKTKSKLYETYDIRIVERIMHQSFSPEARVDMKRINQMWAKLGENVDANNLGIIEMFKVGKIVACGDKEFIITYKTAALCNQVMRLSFKEKANSFLEKILGDKYNYIALPEKIWLDKRQEYVDQYTIGTKYPKLSPINDPELIIYSREYIDPKDKVINKVKSMFGEDIVNVK